MKNLFHNWFAKSRRIDLRMGGNFNHCSSVCAYQSGILVAWYGGSGECRDDQSVYVVFIDRNRQSTPLRIGDKTGNPILIPYDSDKVVLLWSKFEDSGTMRSIVDRWKFCSLSATFMQYHKGHKTPQLLGTPEQIASSDQHLLARCNPIMYGGKYLLPLYDEVDRQGVIYRGEGLEYKSIGRLGKNMIQPTLWVGKWKDRIHSLSRNFMDKTHRKSHQCYSDDGGETWSSPSSTMIPNRNSSLHVLRWNDYDLILWNNTSFTQRKDITLGILDGMEVSPIAILDDYGAYPSMCIDRNGDLNMSYTSIEKTIVVHTWNYKQFKKVFRRCGHRACVL